MAPKLNAQLKEDLKAARAMIAEMEAQKIPLDKPLSDEVKIITKDPKEEGGLSSDPKDPKEEGGLSSHSNQRPTKDQILKRRERIPLSGGNRIPQIKLPGFHLVCSNADRVAWRLDMSYTFVTYGELENAKQYITRTGDATSMDSRVTIDAGDGQIQYLMKLPIEYWNDDRARLEQQITNSTKAIHKNDRDEFKVKIKTTKTEPIEIE